MYADGICRVTDHFYSKTIQFQDINYQLSQPEDQTAVFDGWCDFLNYFDPSVRCQITCFDATASKESFSQNVAIAPKGDDFDDIRREYTEMLQNQQAKGNNGLVKTKYLTFGIEADTAKLAKPRLERIETDILNNFKQLGVAAETLNGYERLHLLYDMFHTGEQAPFRFSWDWLVPSGLSVKDFIAPSSFEFAKGNMFGMGNKVGAVSFLQILAPEMNDRVIKEFLDMESSLILTMHFRTVDQMKAIKTIKRKITDLDKMKIEEQKKAVRSGYDMDIIPSDLATYGTEAKKLLQDLQSHNERMFLITFLLLNTADTKQKLDNILLQASSIAQQHNCLLTRLDFRQEEGLMSSLPLACNQVEIERGLTTSSTAIFVPFTTQELFQLGKEALYCGLNALSNNLIILSRLRCAHLSGCPQEISNCVDSAEREYLPLGITETLSTLDFIDSGLNVCILGPSDSGKSYLAKALGIAACNNYKVEYHHCEILLEELVALKAVDYSKYQKRLKKICGAALLVLDDFLLNTITDEREVKILFEILEKRCEINLSTIICSQREPASWSSMILNDEVSSNAIMKRATRHYTVVIKPRMTD